ncbi:hypothetical protein BKA70DRAFT_1449352 [Coprinopsis sp. MPI-PUGE-AT-0042]|nr:hypothetical protein BKA70DRAFT_1449352 [Coprinopsis sp. MPI-PUGE-AT-0042]
MDVELRIICLVGVWLEGLLYGVYLCLFIAAFPLLFRSKPLRNFSAAVFVVGNALMFVLISIFNVINIFIPITAFAYQTDTHGTRRVFDDQHLWMNSMVLVLGLMTFIIGDTLVASNISQIRTLSSTEVRRYIVIMVPVVLAALSAAFHTATLWFVFTVPWSFVVVRNWAILVVTFILYPFQNALTTSLIVYKIYSHHRQMKAVGLVSVHTPRLLPIMKIIIESAAIYTAGVFALLVLIAMDHPARSAMHTCMMPIIGIVFVLMAWRTHALEEDSKRTPATPSLMPSWLGLDEPKAEDPWIETAGEAEPPSRPRNVLRQL